MVVQIGRYNIFRKMEMETMVSNNVNILLMRIFHVENLHTVCEMPFGKISKRFIDKNTRIITYLKNIILSLK